MALNIITDRDFDSALTWLSKEEKKTKADIVRESILERFHTKKNGFQFGSLKKLMRSKKNSSRAIERELKEMDKDHDLD